MSWPIPKLNRCFTPQVPGALTGPKTITPPTQYNSSHYKGTLLRLQISAESRPGVFIGLLWTQFKADFDQQCLIHLGIDQSRSPAQVFRPK